MTKRQKKKLIRRTAIKIKKLSPTKDNILIIEINLDEIHYDEASPFLNAASKLLPNVPVAVFPKQMATKMLDRDTAVCWLRNLERVITRDDEKKIKTKLHVMDWKLWRSYFWERMTQRQLMPLRN